MCRRLCVPVLAIVLAAAGSGTVVVAEGRPDTERFHLEVEAGAAWQNRNDVEVPNDGTATRFSLVDLVGSGPWPVGRVYFAWDINDRHGLRLLLAPFAYSESGTFAQPVAFAGATYAANTPTDATYQFNSWRITYRYRFWQGRQWRWWIGGTAKIRDAKIELSQGSTSSRDTDVGFVPLLYVRGDWNFLENWHLELDADGLGGGPGRAEDISIKVAYDIEDQWSVSGGYRLLEGGVDVESVYNFAWFNYAVFSFTYRWGRSS